MGIFGKITINRITHDSENQIIESFKKGVEIYKDGEKINNDHYDYYQHLNKNIIYEKRIDKPIISNDSNIEQVNPDDFFKSSLNDLAQKIKNS